MCAETKRLWQPYGAIKQAITSHLKRRAFTRLVFMFCFFSPRFLGKPCLGPRVFTANEMLCARLSSCLPLPSCFMFAYLFAFTYSYLRFGRSFFSPLDICQYGLDLNGPSLSSEVGAGDSLEKQTFKLNEGEHRLLYNSSGPPAEDPLCSRVTV